MKAKVIAVCVLLALAGCGKAIVGQVPDGAGYKLYEAATTRSASTLSVIDSRSHAVDRQLPLGTPSLDWKHLYSVSSRTLVDTDPHSGTTLHVLRLPGSYLLPPATMSGVPGGLSQNGRWLVLQAFDDNPTGLPTATHMLVVDTSYAKQPIPIELPGFFEFDAISNDGKRVFLIEFVSGTIYHVRFFDVGIGKLDKQIVFDKSDGTDAMTGLRLSGVPSSDGQWLFSVYAREHASSFIHALNLDAAIAFCIDLPGSGYTANPDEFRWSLAMSANGTHLYAANGATGIVADVNLDNGVPGQMRASKLNNSESGRIFGVQNVEAKEIASGGAVLSPDGRTLVITGKTGVTWVDTAGLQARSRQLTDWRVWSLGLSPDGQKLYAINDAGMIAELSMAGGAGATFSGAPGQPLALIRVEAAAAP